MPLQYASVERMFCANSGDVIRWRPLFLLCRHAGGTYGVWLCRAEQLMTGGCVYWGLTMQCIGTVTLGEIMSV